MTVPEHLEKNKTPRISYELLPPVKGSSIMSIFNTLDQLMAFDPPFINITYHREETTYIKQPDGTEKPVIIRKRPGTVGMSAAIKAKYNVDVVPHIICGGFSKQETEDALIELDFLGIHNLLVLRGDADKNTGRFDPNPDGNMYASELLQQIIDMNNGKYFEQYVDNPNRTNFSVGVAGYPEKHAESPNTEKDILYLKKKVDIGAEYIVTQMFYDNNVFFDFMERCYKAGINVPIIPGIKPISIKKHLQAIPKIFHLTMPAELRQKVENCSNNEDVNKVGIEWAINQIQELFDNGLPLIHMYTMGRAKNVVSISKAVL
ncbi:MAG: methylenetetrahydrofolate reductase [NAD(P)H] [Bacteroidota bacterium]